MATEVLRPNGVGVETAISFQFPNELQHYDKVDEDPPDDDTTYVHTASGSYQRDLYALPAPAGAGIISQIEVFICWRNTQIVYDVGAKASIHTHATTYDGTERLTKSETYINFSEIWTTNPNTGSPWTWAEIDALEIGGSLWGGPAGKYVRCTQVYVVVTYTPVTEKFSSDSSSGVDEVSAFARAVSDAGVGTESAISPEVGDLTSHDTGIGVDTAKLDKEAFASDNGVGADSVITLAKPPPGIYRIFYVEKFTGSEAYNRPFWSHSVIDTLFLANLWREPVPFNLSSEYGLAIAHRGDYCWLSSPAGVWRAPLAIQSLDLTADVLSVRLEQAPESGKLTIEMRNDDGRYTTLPAPLALGCQLDFSPGYATPAGKEVSPGQTYILEAYEHISSGGKATLVLIARDGWQSIDAWRARHQFRWNKATNELNTRDILAFVLARIGLKLEVISQSSVITGYYPDFIINPNAHGETVIRKLLSFVPDVIFIEGNKAYLVNPLDTDASVYSYFSPYTTDHVIQEGRYRVGAWELSRIQVEGDGILADSFAWGEIDQLYDRFRQLYDRNLATGAQAQERGQAYLREAELESANGIIRIPVNCGQQLYDVIDITDTRAGLSAEKKRVLGLVLVHNPAKAQYEQRLALGAV